MGKSTIGKYQVAIKSLRLDFVDSDKKDLLLLLLMIDIAWKAQTERSTNSLMPQFPRPGRKTRRECTKKKKPGSVDTGPVVFEWDDEFETTCDFSRADDGSFLPWNVCFRVLQGGMAESEKATVIGKVSLNIAELAGKMESASVERKLPIALQVAGNTIEASLSVTLSFVEVRICTDSDQLGVDSADLDGWLRIARAFGIRKGRKKHRKTQSNPDSVNSTELDSSSSDTGFDSSKRSKGFWKKRRLSFSSARVKSEPLIDTTSTTTSTGSEPTSQSSGTFSLPCSPSNWEEKELVSRDGKSKLQANVFLASFDQRSKEADGEGACAALVAVFAHWLHSNRSDEIPTRLEFDNLIKDGSTEWRRLLETNRERFLNGHFDLETILQANIRPLTVTLDKSFTGFFIPDRFDSLHGAMSFDEIWDRVETETGTEPESEFIYIVSWNDHFFVMMAKGGSYYIVDSLGERLFEGCSQGFILKFDESSFVAGENGEVICRGRDCCREFIKRFLASVPLEEIEEEKRKLGSEAIPVVSLHRKLQIEFHYTSVVTSSGCALSSDQMVSLGDGNGSAVLG